MTDTVARQYGLQPADITAADTESTPVDSDDVILVRAGAIKRLSWANLKVTLKSWLVGISNSWTEPQTAPVEDITFAATLDDDTSAGSVNQKVTLTGNITALTLSNGINGQTRCHTIVQDGTGGWTVTWSGIGGTAPTVPVGADEIAEVYYKRIEGQWRFVMAHEVA